MLFDSFRFVNLGWPLGFGYRVPPEVSIDEFVDGTMKLKGAAKSIDVRRWENSEEPNRRLGLIKGGPPRNHEELGFTFVAKPAAKLGP